LEVQNTGAAIAAESESAGANRTAWIQMHVCVLLWGFTAIIGKAITMPAFPLVWWRMMLCVVALMLFPGFWKGLRRSSLRQLAAYAGIGVLVAAHWVTFYGAIKLSNASAAASCMALGPVFVALIEPFVMGGRFQARELGLALACLPGVALVVGGVPLNMRGGIAMGIVAGALSGIFGTLNKRVIGNASALAMTGLEMGAGVVTLSMLAPIWPGVSAAFVAPDRRDTILLLALTILCTLLPFALALVALRRLSAFGSTLAVNMEPVYAIVLAMLFFHEERELGLAFYAGVTIIVLVVFSYPLMARKSRLATSAIPDRRQS
jgi:drug/metabolite transporter (DMT)-like permease